MGGSPYKVFGGEKLKKKHHLENRGINVRIILKWIKAIYDGRV